MWISSPIFAENSYGTKESLSLTTNSELRFIAMGDWGDDNSKQYKVADAMGEWCEQHTCEFIFALGDNFYDHGIFSADDKRFETTWSDVYSHPGISNLTWYVTAGNHDHGNSASHEDGHEWFQVQHSDLDPQWDFPDLAYSLTLDIKDSKIKFVTLDTESIRHDVNNPEDMISFLETELKETDADWKIVVGHHPCYTASAKLTDGELIRDKILPIMQEYSTDIYLTGHQHNQQHFQVKDHPEEIDHVITGGGGKTLEKFSQDNEDKTNEMGMDMKFFDYNFGFAYFTIDENSISWKFINIDGEVVYEYSRSK